MELTPREKDKLLLFTAALVAERRLARGLKLNYPESVALISAAGLEIMLYALFRMADIYDIASLVLNVKSILLFVLVLVCSRYVPKVKKLHPVAFIAASAVIGILFKMAE